MYISRKADYAVRTVLCLAKNKEKTMKVHEISQKMKIPRSFLAKILQVLAKNKLVQSVKGIRGGFKLNKKPDKITLLEVLEIIDGPIALNQCAVDRRVCSLINRCSVHPVWVQLRKDMRKRLAGMNFKKLARL